MYTRNKQKKRKKPGSLAGRIMRANPESSMLAFKEHSPVIGKEGDLKNKTGNAHELFNLFTASIIKNNTVFTR